MGQRYEGTLIVQTIDQTSPTGDYVLSLLTNQAEEGDIKDNKQGYDSVGNIVTGSNKGGYAGRIYSYAEMDSYLTEENVGRILTYMGDEESSDGGMTNAIQVGDVIDKLYFDTTVTPDFSILDWDNYDEKIDSSILKVELIKFEHNTSSSDGWDSLHVRRYAESRGDTLTKYSYALVLYGDNIIWTNYSGLHDMSPSLIPDPSLNGGWNLTGYGKLSEDGSIDVMGNTVKSLKYENIWSSYISKDGQWSDNTPKYVTGQTYQVVKDGETIEFKAIRY